MKQYWTAPELWPGATFVIVAGGPSLTAQQVEACREVERDGRKVRLIAVNNGYAIAPWADVLYFCDDRWWQWHHRKVGDWQGLIVRLAGGLHDFGDKRIKVMKNDNQDGQSHGGLAKSRDALRPGMNAGYQAINLAVHLGARRILLLGFDMQAKLEGGLRRTHWFGSHPGGVSDTAWEHMLPWFKTLVAPLAERGIELLNCTPGSRIRCFPHASIESALFAKAAA